MSIVYRSIRKAWRILAPASFNDAAFGGRSRFSRAILAGKARLERLATHDDLYDETYYRKYSDEVTRSAVGIVETIMRRLSPTSIIDIGCGSGEVIRRFTEVHVSAKGLDYSDAALAVCRERGLDVQKCDLEGDLARFKQMSADLVISTEVAEHLPAACADGYVDLLCTIAHRYVVLTAAPPGQGGTDHVNEQPNSYWIEKFRAHGVRFLDPQTRAFRQEWASSGVDSARANNVMVFEKAVEDK